MKGGRNLGKAHYEALAAQMHTLGVARAAPPPPRPGTPEFEVAIAKWQRKRYFRARRRERQFASTRSPLRLSRRDRKRRAKRLRSTLGELAR